MRIEVKGRNLPISDELREAVFRTTGRISRQVSPLAVLEILLEVERGGTMPDCHIADATLRLKGTTLRSRKASPDLRRSISMVADDLERQVKRHCEKRRGRRAARVALDGVRTAVDAAEAPAEPAPADVAATV
jgi:putative sigma-54 modulation protein